MKKKSVPLNENAFINNLTGYKKFTTDLIEQNYKPNVAIHELLQNGREHGNSKMFKLDFNDVTNVMVYHDDGKNWTYKKIKAFLETYVYHDTSSIDNSSFLGTCSQMGSGLKNAIIYMASPKESSKVTFYFTTTDSEVYTCEMLIDKLHPENEYVTELVEATNLQNIEFGMTIIQTNIRPLYKDFKENLINDIATSCRVDKTMKVYINGAPVHFYEPMHLKRLFELAHVNNETELENGFYNDKTTLFGVIKARITKRNEFKNEFDEDNAPIEFMLIPALYNISYIEKTKPEDFKNDINKFGDTAGVFVGIGDSWIERGGNLQQHICKPEGHYTDRFKVALILNNEAFKVFGGKSCKMAGIDAISLDSSAVNSQYEVDISTLPPRYRDEGNKIFKNLLKAVRDDFSSKGVSFAKYAKQTYSKLDENGFPDSFCRDILNCFANGEVRSNRLKKTKPTHKEIKESLEVKTVEKIPIDQATVPNFVVEGNQKPVKVDQKSMLYNMYDENGIILRSLDSYGKPVYTPTEHFPIGRSPLDIITNIYDYLIDSGLLTPEEVKTMNISLVSSFES